MEEFHDPAVPGSGHEESLIPQGPAVFVNDGHVVGIGMSINAGIHIRLYRLRGGTAHLPFGSGAWPGWYVSQFTIGTLVRLLSGHGGLPGHVSLREAGRSAGRREDNRPHAAGVRRAVGQTDSPGKYSARDPDRPPCRASGQTSGPSQISSEGPFMDLQQQDKSVRCRL